MSIHVTMDNDYIHNKDPLVMETLSISKRVGTNFTVLYQMPKMTYVMSYYSIKEAFSAS